MNMKEAIDKLKGIAPDKYQSVTYEVISWGDNVTQKCKLYVEAEYPEGHIVTGKTWDEAFRELDYAMHPDKKPVLIIEDVPEL